MDETNQLGAARTPLFAATLTPYRSLPQRGFFVLMLAVAGVSFITGLLFWSLGAWPVTGFFGLDVLLLYLAFRWSYRAARLTELVELRPGELKVTRIEPSGRSRIWRFEPSWTRAELERRGMHDSRIVLALGRRRLVIGSFLAPEERGPLAEAIQAALLRYRGGPLAAGS